MITVAAESPASPDAVRLIAGSEAELAALYPPEERFALSPEELLEADVHFVIARQDGLAAGCGGLAVLEDYGELKRIFVDPDRRGAGLAHRILQALEDEARRRGLPVIRLETGAEQRAALALYESRGYRPCAAFADYPNDGTSLFRELSL